MRLLLYPLTILYWIAVYLRNRMYELGIVKVYKAGVPVISVGNINLGGTGKTPVVEFISEYFINKGKKIAIISRGYKRTTKGSVIVSDGKKILAKSEESGDEPYQMANKIKGSIVAVDESRSRISRIIEQNYKPDIIIMDDGFQHRKMYRDLDIVLINSKRKIMDNILLPAGNLREPFSSLKRANVILISKSDDDYITDKIKKYSEKDIYFSNIKEYELVDLKNIKYPDEYLSDKTVFILSAIANPENFEKSVMNMGGKILKSYKFRDHHFFSINEIKKIISDYVLYQPDIIIMTEKDFSRMRSNEDFLKTFINYPCFILKIKMGIYNNEDMFFNRINGILN